MLDGKYSDNSYELTPIGLVISLNVYSTFNLISIIFKPLHTIWQMRLPNY